MKKKNGFTLIELLAVIVILAIILVIAVPKILSVINDATKNSFESSLKMIASSAEKDYQIKIIKGETPADGNCEAVATVDAGLKGTVCSVTYGTTEDTKGTAVVAVTTAPTSGKFKGCIGTYNSATQTFTTEVTCS